MPLYDFECEYGHKFDRFLPLAKFDEPQLCICGSPARKLVSAPFIQADIPGYRSPVTGEWVAGRRERREDLTRHGCVEYDRGMGEELEARRRRDGERLEARVEETVEKEIALMPAQKRERLVAELEGGAAVNVERKPIIR